MLLVRPRGATHLLVLAHGAGAGMRHVFLEQLAEALAAERIATWRWEFPYMAAGKKLPDRPPVAEAAVREAWRTATGKLGLPAFAGGKSFGGRMTSQAHAREPLPRARGLVFVGFPLHPPDKPGTARADHLRDASGPLLFVQGTRDALAPLPRLRPVVRRLGDRAELHVVRGADHGLEDREPELAAAIAAWMRRHAPCASARYARAVSPRALACATAAVALAGCHVPHTIESTRPGSRLHTRDRAHPTASPPTIVITDDARLRVVEPLVCPTTDLTAELDSREVRQDPNLATFIVGIVLTAAGGIVLANGALGHESALAAAGAIGAGAGLVLDIGPWIPRASTFSEDRVRDVTTPGAPEPCGDRPLAGAAGSATLAIEGREVYGAIDADGVFDVSPFALFDAFDLGHVHAAEIRARLAGGRELTTLLDGAALARAQPAFLAHADFDGAIAPLRLVPELHAETPRVTLGSETARIALVVHDAGPGDAYALRGAIVSSSPALDGRVIYVGHLARGQTATRELVIPLSPEANAALRGGDVDISIELRDAHGTAPAAPVRYHGPLLVDPSR